MKLLSRNNSLVFGNGTKHLSNNHGVVTIIARVEEEVQLKSGYKKNPFYLIVFDTGEIKKARDIDITNGDIAPISREEKREYFRNEVTAYNVGTIGEGKYKTTINGKKDKGYILWRAMLRRCYSEEYHKAKPSYKDCTVSEDWKNYQIFRDEIKHLDNYDKWLICKNFQYALDKDLKIKGNRIYSKETCMFVTIQENTAGVIGKKYIATRIHDEYMMNTKRVLRVLKNLP